MLPIQIKWMNDGRFRRFDLKEHSFTALLCEMQRRVPTFGGTICYIDDQNDKIVVENDQDLMDMIDYFGQIGQNVVRIQTDHVSSNEEGGRIGQQKSMSETERTEGGQSGREFTTKRNKNGANPPNNIIASGTFANFMEKLEAEEQQSPHSSSQFVPDEHINGQQFPLLDWTQNFGRQSASNAHSQSSSDRAERTFEETVKTKRSVSNVIPCMECGMMVANAGTSLKCHVNLHHLKLPIYSCRQCDQHSTHLQKAAIVRHIEREHPGISTDEFNYNYPSLSGQIQQKMAECFPGRKPKIANDSFES